MSMFLPRALAGCLLAASLTLYPCPAPAVDIPADVSPQSRACIECHLAQTPGIVHDWMGSRHAATTPAAALSKPAITRRISAQEAPVGARHVVGCFECHSLRAAAHRDGFQHFGQQLHVVVTPDDCATCHPVEVRQFSGSKKAHAWGNLMANPVYSLLVETIDSVKEVDGQNLKARPASTETKWETCLGCHGTSVEVAGMRRVETKMGPIEVPRLVNWPNQGVGRINPDGSRGCCASCHARHAFRISDARRPYTCGQCHLEPDVPAWDVYKESKHGNIFESRETSWEFNAVPWRIGQDFQAPTCAVCHNSTLVNDRGQVVAERNHDFGSRLWVRLFGLIYSHPQPTSGDTSLVRNGDGQPLPTTFSGAKALPWLITASEQEAREARMEQTCRGCHSGSWVAGHFRKLAATCAETDRMVATATTLMQQGWRAGLADPKNPFDEPLERLWVRQWLFYANSVRYSSAMSGAPDYTAFKNGWWSLSETMARMAWEVEGKDGATRPAAAMPRPTR